MEAQPDQGFLEPPTAERTPPSLFFYREKSSPRNASQSGEAQALALKAAQGQEEWAEALAQWGYLSQPTTPTCDSLPACGQTVETHFCDKGRP